MKLLFFKHWTRSLMLLMLFVHSRLRQNLVCFEKKSEQSFSAIRIFSCCNSTEILPFVSYSATSQRFNLHTWIRDGSNINLILHTNEPLRRIGHAYSHSFKTAYGRSLLLWAFYRIFLGFTYTMFRLQLEAFSKHGGRYPQKATKIGFWFISEKYMDIILYRSFQRQLQYLVLFLQSER